MNQDEFRAFTQNLKERLQRDSLVIGLVAVGSMAEQDYSPDQWSDHDFFVVVSSGTQETFRSDLSWLPHSESIIFRFRETAHGVKVLYDTGHLLEFAVFDLNELHLAKVNRYRILIDKGGIESHLQEIVTETARWNESQAPDDEYLLGQFLTNVLVGVNRYLRGEKLSGQFFLKNSAIRHLVILLSKHLPSENRNLLDNLDPFRRFERAYPEIGANLNALFNEDLPAAAIHLLDFAERTIGHLPQFPTKAFDTVRSVVRKANDDAPF
jgi:hypothetical protein